MFKQNAEKVDDDGGENAAKIRSLGTIAVNSINKNNNNKGRQKGKVVKLSQ